MYGHRTTTPTMHAPPPVRHHRAHPAGRLLALLMTVLLVTGMAAAQNVVTGTVEATVDGEERTWYTMALEGDETGDPTATWSAMMGITTFNIRAHAERSWAIRDALSIDLTSFTAPDGCPCTIPAASVTLWTDSGIMENIYRGEDVDVVITRFDPLGDEVYALEGTVEGTLQFYPAVNREPEPDRTVGIAGTFAIEHLPSRSLE